MFKWGSSRDLSTCPGLVLVVKFSVVDLEDGVEGGLGTYTALRTKPHQLQPWLLEAGQGFSAQRSSLGFPERSKFRTSVGVITLYVSFVENWGQGHLSHVFHPLSSRLQFLKWEFYCSQESRCWKLSRDPHVRLRAVPETGQLPIRSPRLEFLNVFVSLQFMAGVGKTLRNPGNFHGDSHSTLIKKQKTHIPTRLNYCPKPHGHYFSRCCETW